MGCPFSGQIKLVLSSGSCSNSQTRSGTINLSLINVGNTADSQLIYGTDVWIGHAYNWTGSAPPGGSSPNTPSENYPFNTDNYVGYYEVNSETINEDFGGDNASFPLLSEGINRVNILTDRFAVRYKMKSTRPAGCYIFTFTGDDGIRMYANNVKVFDTWREQSTTTYTNLLVYLDGNTDLVFDFYENGGLNIAKVSINPFTTSSNNITESTLPSCADFNSGVITGSNYTYNGSLTNPSIGYQWQVSTDNATFVDIPGANGIDYTPPALSSLSEVKHYRRSVFANATASYSCALYSNVITVEVDETVWDGTAWSNGVPNNTMLAIINGNYDTTLNGNIECCSLIVNTGSTLNVQSDDYINIENNLTVDGALNILNNGSLVQINDSGINTGNISYERIASVKLQDYVYWSSPVSGFDVNSISPGTPAYYHWAWNPTISNSNGGQGNWISASTTMNAGQGYIVRAPNGFSNSTNQNWTALFNNGAPNNGIYTPTISRGSNLNSGTAGPNGIMRTDTDDNWNLLGNPYPSAISINTFLTTNTNIDGFVRLWTHGTSPSTGISDPFYDNFVSNYTAGDYVAINGAGATSGPGATGVIGGSQGFFVLMNTGGAASETVIFNNSMRNKGYSNSQFYRSAANKNQTVGEKSRIWLDLNTPTNETTRTLVAYIDEATNSRDRMYDAITDYKSPQNLYTLIGPEAFTIQGRAAFNEEDKVPVGFKASTPGTHSISIATVDGLFENNQNIFLEDTELNVIHDLRQAPYSFYALASINNERFVLRYTDGRLSNDDNQLFEDGLFVVSNENIQITSNNMKIKNVEIYDVLGRRLISKRNVDSNTLLVNEIVKSNNALIVNIVLDNNIKISRKILF